MTALDADVERRLQENCERQLCHYDRALALVQKHAASTDDVWVNELTYILADVAELDAAVTADRQRWQHAGQAPGPALRHALARLAERIRNLGEHVDQHVRHLQARKLELLPELDQAVQERRMLQAYRSRLA